MPAFGMSYPPDSHLLRDLRLALIQTPGEGDRIELPLAPELLDRQGYVHPGVLATVVDVVGAGTALRAIHPDWLATADLRVVTRDRPDRGPIRGAARVLRSGRTTTVIEVDLVDGGSDRPLAWATMTFARIVRPDATKELELPETTEATRSEMALPESRFAKPFMEQLGITSGPRGVEMPRSQYTVNSFGSLQGGIVMTLVEAAALASVAGEWGDAVVDDLDVQFLEKGLEGPYVARAEDLQRLDADAVVRVTMGEALVERPMAIGVARVRR